MNGRDPVCSILLITEDGAKKALDTCEAVVRSMLLLIDPMADLSRVRFEPLNDERLASVLHGNVWKSNNPEHRPLIVELRKRIATTLMQRQRPGFVAFHFDGDEPWSRREASVTPAQFRARIVEKVGELIVKKKNKDPSALDRLGRLLACVPYYSIEAWLYQNTDVAVSLLEDRFGGSHVTTLLAWQADRTKLDEVVKPKEQTPLRDHFNHELASRAYPAEDVYRAARSFALSVDVLKACAPLVDALGGTRIAPDRSGVE